MLQSVPEKNCTKFNAASFCNRFSDILIGRLQQLFRVTDWLFPRSNPFCITGRHQSASMGCSWLDRYWPAVYCADVITITRQHRLDVQSYDDDTQLYFHAVTDISAVDINVQKLVACRWYQPVDVCQPVEINQDNIQFIWLGTSHQLSKLQLQTITLEGVDIVISTEAMCLGVLLDTSLTFAPVPDARLARVFIICGRWIPCVSHTRKMLPQPWYMHSLLVGLTIVTVSSTVWVQPVFSLYRTCSTPQLKSYCISGSLTTSPLTFEIHYIGCLFKWTSLR